MEFRELARVMELRLVETPDGCWMPAGVDWRALDDEGRRLARYRAEVALAGGEQRLGSRLATVPCDLWPECVNPGHVRAQWFVTPKPRYDGPGAARYRKFGITEPLWQEKLASQEGACAVCKRELEFGRGKYAVVWRAVRSGEVEFRNGEIWEILCTGCRIRRRWAGAAEVSPGPV